MEYAYANERTISHLIRLLEDSILKCYSTIVHCSSNAIRYKLARKLQGRPTNLTTINPPFQHGPKAIINKESDSRH